MQITTDDHGRYREIASIDPAKEEVYTAFVKYRYGPEGDHHYYEEIDVRALNGYHARAVATEALRRDYEPGGTVEKVVHRPRGILY